MAERDRLRSPPSQEQSTGGKHYLCEVTFLLFAGQELSDPSHTFPHRNCSWQLMLCAKLPVASLIKQ